MSNTTTTTTTTTVTPEVLWAQRSSKTDSAKNFVYLTISVPDVPASNLQLELKPEALVFTGYSETLKKMYHLELEFYAEIDEAESKTNHTAKNVEMKLRKKALDDAYWPRLLKGTKKAHFLKTDFDKWVDEDEQNASPDDEFGNFSGGMGGMPGMGSNDFNGIDFSKLGSGDLPAEDSDDDLPTDDEEMPGLEGEDNDVADEKSSADPAAAAPGVASQESPKETPKEETPAA